MVVKGDQLGRQLGFPTANLRFDDYLQHQKAKKFDSDLVNQGLYYGAVSLVSEISLNIDNKPALIFIGPRLVLGETKVVWEAHIINENSGVPMATTPLPDSLLQPFPEFYGAKLQIKLLRKLRDNMNFDSLEALKVQMGLDLEQARQARPV